MEIRWSPKTHKLVGGPATVRGATRFEWIEDGHFLVHHQGGADGAPDARWLMGRDETSGAYSVLYADARGVSRVYRECTAAMTTLSPILHSSCDIAAKYPRLGGHSTATESEPVQAEEDNHVATVVVPVTALVCDVVGWVPSFDRSRMHPVNDAV